MAISSKLKIRPYIPDDKEAVIELLDLNIPKFFDRSEKEDLQKYLETEIEDYYVVEENDQIIGAGGINYSTEGHTATISWDIIAPNTQGKGIGRKLTEHRIKHINKNDEIDLIVVRTSQFTFKFYEKMGFKLVKIEKDFWADGFDLYFMEQENKM
ncbi:GNAT family N-acetyltransferase [Aquimarina rubra]|uniref:GNAT family N-acetyltransferase n=1 Tax=Aquimarina rubra TaxID=1920033 RepID=A0ABW5L9P0_9FLAO